MYDENDAKLDAYYDYLEGLASMENWMFASVGRFLLNFAALESEVTALVAHSWFRVDRLEEASSAILGRQTFGRKLAFAELALAGTMSPQVPFTVVAFRDSSAADYQRTDVEQLPDADQLKRDLRDLTAFRNALAHKLIQVNPHSERVTTHTKHGTADHSAESLDSKVDEVEHAAHRIALYRLAVLIEQQMPDVDWDALPIGAACGIASDGPDAIRDYYIGPTADAQLRMGARTSPPSPYKPDEEPF